jgi:hypothetical protein
MGAMFVFLLINSRLSLRKTLEYLKSFGTTIYSKNKVDFQK